MSHTLNNHLEDSYWFTCIITDGTVHQLVPENPIYSNAGQDGHDEIWLRWGRVLFFIGFIVDIIFFLRPTLSYQNFATMLEISS
jgi:hypothetical protein